MFCRCVCRIKIESMLVFVNLQVRAHQYMSHVPLLVFSVREREPQRQPWSFLQVFKQGIFCFCVINMVMCVCACGAHSCHFPFPTFLT